MAIVKWPHRLIATGVQWFPNPPENEKERYASVIGKLEEHYASMDPKPLGLAANQIGEDAPIFLIHDKAYVCPQYERIAGIDIIESSEGCYSLVDGHFYSITRLPSIRAHWFDKNFRPQTKIISGLDAIIFQHEDDHLRGRLCWRNDPKASRDSRALQEASGPRAYAAAPPMSAMDRLIMQHLEMSDINAAVQSAPAFVEGLRNTRSRPNS